MQSTVKIKQLIQKAKQDGMKAVALTDRNVLHGAIEFYQACLAEQVKPIIGMETTVEMDDQLNQVLLLAKNNNGYQSLMKISSLIQTAEQAKITMTDLTEILEDCFIILPIGYTQLAEAVKSRDLESIQTLINVWPTTPLIGLTQFDLDAMSFLQDVPADLIALGSVRYLEPSDQEAYAYLRAIDEKTPVTEHTTDAGHYFFSQAEAATYFEKYPALIEQTNKLAASCDVQLKLDGQLLPRFPLESDQDAASYLQQLCEKALMNKYADSDRKEAASRLEYELSIINNMGFSDYFLIVWDFVQFAKSEDILVGPGRGSAAGSLVAYLLEITNIDPIKYELLFERFLNPERISMPDIDIDFSDYRRNEVIDYVRGKYGNQHVAQIGTFGTFKTRSTIRELAKVFELAPEELSFILSEVPAQGAQSIAKTVRGSIELLDYIKQQSHLKRFFKVANLIEDLPRNMSTHAAGVVIHDEPLVESVPLMADSSGNRLTQMAMGELEKIGLLKMDFLGLRNLTTIERILKMIARNQEKPIDLDEIPIDDQATYSLFQTGQTNGIFQFESQGMKNVLRKLKPTHFEDVVAVNALYRPGPMDFIDTFIKRKNNQEPVTYLHPNLKSILSSTYGVLVYQEQVIQLAHRFAGLSLGKADLLRRAISKKDQVNLEKLKQQFIQGCSANGYDQSIAEELFSWIMRFANYGFNRSHAVSYSMIAYYLAYFKANYPVYFLSELLNTVVGDQNKVAAYIKEAKQSRIKLLAPSINKSHYYYQPDRGQIRMGLSSIKGLSYPIAREIVQERKQGPFTSLFDFCLRVPLNLINRAVLEKLTLAGVFDEFGVERASLLASIDQAIEQGELFGGLGDQESLFGDSLNLEDNYQVVDPLDILVKLSYEKDLLGLYVSDHPLEINRQVLRTNGIMDLVYFHQHTQVKNIAFAAVIQSAKVIRTKRGESMAFVQFSDENMEVEGVVFPTQYREVKPWLEEQKFVRFTGKKEWRQGKEQIIVDKMEPLDFKALATQNEPEKRLFIRLEESKSINTAIEKVEQLANQHPGTIPVLIYQADRKKTFLLAEKHYISDQYQSLNALKASFGAENVVLK